MSIEARCKCGEYSDIRFSFVDKESEREYHDNYSCNKCKKNEMDIQKERKETPIKSGVLDYFPDAIRAVAQCSYVGNEQHNPGTKLHWDRTKSGDELDALARHLLDAGTVDTDGVAHSAKVAWRALANLQKEIERNCQEDYEEELLAQISEDEEIMAQYMYDGEECGGVLGSHPLCCTDYCPCFEGEIDAELEIYGVQRGPCSAHNEASEEEIVGSIAYDLAEIEREKRMDIIGRNGNDGLHYDDEFDRLGDSSINMTHDYEAPVFSSRLSDYPEPDADKSWKYNSSINNIKVNYEVQEKEGKENNKSK